jgi:hypothetical protein
VIPEYQQRVVIERNELTEKIEKLTAFCCGEKIKELDAAESSRLMRQLQVMKEYQSILDSRIKNFQ